MDYKVITQIIDKVFNHKTDWKWSDGQMKCSVQMGDFVCANIVVSEDDKAKITFVNYPDHLLPKPLEEIIADYKCNFSAYYHVKEVAQDENTLIVKFRDGLWKRNKE